MRAHIRKSGRILLVYGLSQEELEKLNQLTRQKNILCRPVTDAMTGHTVAQLLSNTGEETALREPLSGKFALLAGFEGQESQALDLINEAASGVIKAVCTIHNIGWKFSDLCAEIKSEHLAMQQAEK